MELDARSDGAARETAQPTVYEDLVYALLRARRALACVSDKLGEPLAVRVAESAQATVDSALARAGVRA